jgi:hypothetical protein
MDPTAASASLFDVCQNIGQALWMEGIAVAKVLVPAFIVLRLMPGGFAIMFGKETPAQLLTIVITQWAGINCRR